MVTRAPLTPEELAGLLPEQQQPKPAVVVGREPELAGACASLDGKAPSIAADIASMFRVALRKRVDAKLARATSHTPEELEQPPPVEGEPPPNVFLGVKRRGASGSGVVVVDTPSARRMVALALGGSGSSSGPGAVLDTDRALTTVEKHVLLREVRRLVDAVMNAFGCFAGDMTLDAAVDAVHELREVDRHRRLACTTLSLTGDLEAELCIAVPATWIAAGAAAATATPAEQQARNLRPQKRVTPAHVSFEVHVELGRVHITLSRLLALRAGDVLVLSTPDGAPLPIAVAGRVIAHATPCMNAGPLELKVASVVEPAPPARRVLRGEAAPGTRANATTAQAFAKEQAR